MALALVLEKGAVPFARFYQPGYWDRMWLLPLQRTRLDQTRGGHSADSGTGERWEVLPMGPTGGSPYVSVNGSG